jgi:hypothetical protein
MVSLPRGGQEARKYRAVGNGWYDSTALASEWGVSFTRLAQLSSNMVKQTLTEPAKWLLLKEKMPVVCSTRASCAADRSSADTSLESSQSASTLAEGGSSQV